MSGIRFFHKIADGDVATDIAFVCGTRATTLQKINRRLHNIAPTVIWRFNLIRPDNEKIQDICRGSHRTREALRYRDLK